MGKYWICICLAWGLGIGGCTPVQQYRYTEGKIYGTFYHISYASDEDLKEEILRQMESVNASLSMFNPESVIARLNRNETDSEVSKGDHLCVEGGCRYSRRLLHGKPFYGGMYVEDYKRDTTQFKRAVEMNLRESDGLMVFDIVHIIDRDWWGPLQRAVEAYETGEAGR